MKHYVLLSPLGSPKAAFWGHCCSKSLLTDEAIGDVFTSLSAGDTKVYRNINTTED